MYLRVMTEGAAVRSIYLALSGGGTRAMVFHCGVLKHLAERGQLEQVRKVSTVSGGSLLVGLLLQLNGMRWPTSAEFLHDLLPRVRTLLTTTDLQRALLLAMLRPANWPNALSRANVLAAVLRETWGIQGTMDEIAAAPAWLVNATTAQTGKRAVIERESLRDWALGTTQLRRFLLADAMAVSAAFPGLIGPYAMATDSLAWELPMFADGERARPAEDRFEKIHLYDGGVYDNLGLEPFFDAGFGPKRGIDGLILSSDGGAPLPGGFHWGRLNLARLKHVADIMSDQVRALRVRGLMAHAKGGRGRAAYLRIGVTTAELAARCEVDCPPGDWLQQSEVGRAAAWPTSLKRVPLPLWDLIVRHGDECAAAGAAGFGYARAD